MAGNIVALAVLAYLTGHVTGPALARARWTRRHPAVAVALWTSALAAPSSCC
nr:hypothetical protein GCM10020093_009780 [Planobispora longispora]